MFIFDYIFSSSSVLGIVIKIVIILAIAITLNIIQKRAVPRLIMASIPKIKGKLKDEITARYKTMAYVARKVIAVVIGVIAAIMVMGVIEVDIAPLLASLGVAALALVYLLASAVTLGYNSTLSTWKFAKPKIEVDFNFWKGLGYVGDFYPTESGIDVLVSFNLVDTVMSLVKKKEMIKYLYHHQEALWNKIFSEFIGEEKMEEMIIDNFEKGYLKI